MDVLWLLSSLTIINLLQLTVGQLDGYPDSNLTIDQIIVQLNGGLDVMANRLTLPDGKILAEGDMMLDSDQYQALYDKGTNRRKKRKAVSDTNLRWPGGNVYYRFKAGDFSDSEIYMIKVSMREWEKYTCLTFHEATRNTRNYILFQDGMGCNSQLGIVGGAQELNLDRNGCRWKGLYLHEIGHAVGLVHEHQLPIRDRYIDILYQNVQPAMRVWFNKYPDRQISQFNVDYEYSSVMHYGITAFSSDGKSQTIRTKDRSREKEIGRVYQKELSFTDIEIVNRMYQCSSSQLCPNVRCENGGIVDENCICICPDGSNDCQVGQRNTNPSCSNSGRDINSWKCYIWARQGECVRNRAFMSTNCQKACGICGNENQRRSDVCEDFYSTAKCEKWMTNGDCIVAEDFMKKNCRLTCGFCDARSIDKQPSGLNCPNTHNDDDKCEEWARKGECAANPRWMPFNCQKACRTCPDDGTGVTRATRTTTTTTSRPGQTTRRSQTTTVRPITTTSRTSGSSCENFYPDSYCERNQRLGECTRIPKVMANLCARSCGACNETDCKDRYEERMCAVWARSRLCNTHEHAVWMQANCRKTCGNCTVQTETDKPQVDENCVNKHASCDMWARYNQCVVNPSYMLKFCMKSCRVCTEGLRDAAGRIQEETTEMNETDAGTNIQVTLTVLIICTLIKYLL